MVRVSLDGAQHHARQDLLRWSLNPIGAVSAVRQIAARILLNNDVGLREVFSDTGLNFISDAVCLFQRQIAVQLQMQLDDVELPRLAGSHFMNAMHSTVAQCNLSNAFAHLGW